MNEMIFLLIEPPDGGYPAEALGYAIRTGNPEIIIPLADLCED